MKKISSVLLLLTIFSVFIACNDKEIQDPENVAKKALTVVTETTGEMIVLNFEKGLIYTDYIDDEVREKKYGFFPEIADNDSEKNCGVLMQTLEEFQEKMNFDFKIENNYEIDGIQYTRYSPENAEENQQKNDIAEDDFLKTYDAEFFTDNALIYFTQILEHQPNENVIVEKIYKKSGEKTLYLYIHNISDSNRLYNDAVDTYFGFIEVKKSDIQDIENIEIVFEQTYRPENNTTTAVITADYPEYTGEVDIIETDNVYEYFDVPRPFPETCLVDMIEGFLYSYDMKFSHFSHSFVDEVAKYLGENDSNSLLNEYHNKYVNKNELGLKNDTLEISKNLYTLFKEYNIPKEKIIDIINSDNQINTEILGNGVVTPVVLEINFSEEEIEAIADLDKDALNELFVSDYCIVKGRSIYTPEWLYCHSLEDYTAAEITPDDVKEKLSYFYEFPYNDEAAVFFGDKLSEFTGEDVVFKKWSEWVAENEANQE